MRITVRRVILALCLVGLFARSEEETFPVKVGAYYFDGWTGKTDRWHLPERLINEFGYRKPVWGWVTSTPEIMRQQIDYASDYGLRFFAFCWYYPESADKHTPLNHALELFLQAPNQERMEFCLLVANHAGFRIGPEEWEDVCAYWVSLFKHPSYVRANGKPLLIMHSPHELDRLFGGPHGVRRAFDRLRETAMDAGLPGLAIAGCWTARNVSPTLTLPDQAVESGYTFVAGYNMPHYCAWDWPKRAQPFQHLVDGHLKAWDILAGYTALPYIPVATLGWDMRPWEQPGIPEAEQTIYYPDRTPRHVEDMVRNAVHWVIKNPAKTARERIVLLYAWNEYGEGGYLTPTQQDGTAYLEAVQRGFGDRDSPYVPEGHVRVFTADFTDPDERFDRYSNPRFTTGLFRLHAGDNLNVVRRLADNQERQLYVDHLFIYDGVTLGIDPFVIQNGVLSIRADRLSEAHQEILAPLKTDQAPAVLYSSGLLSTETEGRDGKGFVQLHGYWELRARLPRGQGLWPAFWLVAQTHEYWDEIDVFEVLGHEPDAIYHSTHFHNGGGTEGMSWGSRIYRGIDTSDGFHIYGLQITTNALIYSINGRETLRAPHALEVPLYTIINLAVGGTWPGDPDDSTIFPATMDIDYLRIYSVIDQEYD